MCAYTGAPNSLRQQLLSSPNNQQQQHKLQRSSSAKSHASTSSSPYKNHVFGVDDPNLRKALKNLSLKQAERTYSSNRGSGGIKCEKKLVDGGHNDVTVSNRDDSFCPQKYSQKSSSCQDLSDRRRRRGGSAKGRNTQGRSHLARNSKFWETKNCNKPHSACDLAYH